MEKIFSKIETDKLLHIIVRGNESNSNRIDIIPENNFLQCAVMNLNKNLTFRPHKHIWKERSHNLIAQESWIVIRGSVKCFLYDIDNKLLKSPVLYPGDASFTLEGGHTYEILEDNSLIYEYKTGPYEGQEFDKILI